MTSHNHKILFIHYLRGLAALLVLYFHFFENFWLKNLEIAALAYVLPTSYHRTSFLNLVMNIRKTNIEFGFLGVSIFFLISGFVIPLTLDKTNRRSFVIKRFFRIYPTYAVGLSITCLAIFIGSSLRSNFFPINISEYIGNLSLFRDFFGIKTIDGVNWTLQIEIMFYIVSLVLFQCRWLYNKKKLVIFSVILALISYVFKTLGNMYGEYGFVYVLSFYPHFIIYMLIGTLFYLKYENKERHITTEAGIIFMCFILSIELGENLGQSMLFIVNYFIGLFVFILAYKYNNRIRFNKLLDYLANISFPLYVIHGIIGYTIMTYVYQYSKSMILSIFSAAIISFAFATMLHHLVEKPGIKFGRRLTVKLETYGRIKNT